jgi:hypothetical protein
MDDELFGAIDEARQRSQMESDREFGLRAQQIKQGAQRIAIEKGVAQANAWYQRQMVQLAKDKFTEDVRQFNMNFGEQQYQYRTTAFGRDKDTGAPTMARENMEAGLTGTYGGAPTWERQYQTGELTGDLNGTPTLQKTFGEAGITGYYNGAPTLARQQAADQSLLGWTSKAVELGERPADWVSARRFNLGAGAALGAGLNWQQSPNQLVGQQGTVTASGATPTGSLQDTWGAMGMGAQGGMAGSWAGQAAANYQQAAAQAQANMSPDEQALYKTANDFAENPQAAGAGWWEQQDPLTQQMIQGAALAQGKDWSSVMARYNRSRWGGGGSAMAA